MARLNHTQPKISPKLLAVLLLLLSASLAVWWYLHASIANPKLAVLKRTPAIVELANYHDKTLGFKFTYPKAWGAVHVDEQFEYESHSKIGGAYQISFDNNKLFFGELYTKDSPRKLQDYGDGFSTDYGACNVNGVYFYRIYTSSDTCVKAIARKGLNTTIVIQHKVDDKNYGSIGFFTMPYNISQSDNT